MDSIATAPGTCQPLVVDPLLPAYAVHLLAGAPGAGKTCLAAWLLRQLHDAAPIFGCVSHKPADMAVLVADRGWQSHVQWFDKVGLGAIAHYSFHDDPDFRWERLKQPDGWMWTLLHAIDHLPLAPDSFLLIDPLSAFLGGDLLNYNRVFCALGELGQLCVTRQLTILGTAHSAKQRAGKQFQYTRPQDRILGSAALVGCADTVMYLATPDETRKEYWELSCAPHHAPATSCRLQRDAAGLFVPLAPAAEALELRRRHRLILAAIGDHGNLIRQVVDNVNGALSRRTVFRTINELAEAALIINAGHGIWRRNDHLH